MIERINWMADQSEKGIQQSGGIMVNYLYRYCFYWCTSDLNTFGWVSWAVCCNYDNRFENIEEYALSYSSSGLIHSSPSLSEYLEVSNIGLCFTPICFDWTAPFVTAIFVILLLYHIENSVAAEGFMRQNIFGTDFASWGVLSVIGYFEPRWFTLIGYCSSSPVHCEHEAS